MYIYVHITDNVPGGYNETSPINSIPKRKRVNGMQQNFVYMLYTRCANEFRKKKKVPKCPPKGTTKKEYKNNNNPEQEL